MVALPLIFDEFDLSGSSPDKLNLMKQVAREIAFEVSGLSHFKLWYDPISDLHCLEFAIGESEFTIHYGRLLVLYIDSYRQLTLDAKQSRNLALFVSSKVNLMS